MRLTKVTLQGFALACAALLTWSAQATPITVASDISNLYIGAASSATGRFDVNASAAALGFGSPLSVTSATLSFLFNDNVDPYTTLSGFTGSTTLVRLPDTCGSTLSSCVQHYNWLDRYQTYYLDPLEAATVTVGNQTVTESPTFHHSVFGPSLTPQGHTSCGAFGCGFVPLTRPDCSQSFGVTFCAGPWPVYTQAFTIYEGYDGAFSLDLNLDAAALLDLGNDGFLDFSLSAFAGDFNFLSASLTADIFERIGDVDPVDPAPPARVPEPATPAMLIAGLLMLAVCNRRRSLST